MHAYPPFIGDRDPTSQAHCNHQEKYCIGLIQAFLQEKTWVLADLARNRLAILPGLA